MQHNCTDVLEKNVDVVGSKRQTSLWEVVGRQREKDIIGSNRTPLRW